jgi:hypothetical protein
MELDSALDPMRLSSLSAASSVEPLEIAAARFSHISGSESTSVWWRAIPSRIRLSRARAETRNAAAIPSAKIPVALSTKIPKRASRAIKTKNIFVGLRCPRPAC